MNDTITQQSDQLVFRRMAEPFPQAGTLFPQDLGPILWVVLVLAILAVGLFYIIWMYARDARSVGWLPAVLLGLLRATVYVILAVVFMLPALQRWEDITTYSRVVTLFDVSQSMTETRDTPPAENAPPESSPTRQDLVLKFLDDPQLAFMPKMVERNPVFSYRIGRFLDENFHVFTRDGHWTRASWEERGRPVSTEQAAASAANPQAAPASPSPWDFANWKEWLNPNPRAEIPDEPDEEKRKALLNRLAMEERLISGTNLGESLLGAVKRELGNKVQGVIVFSDGHSTEGTAQTFRELRDRVTKGSIKTPIFVVAVGEDRPPVRLEVTDLRGPEQARPEDEYQIKAEVTGLGLADQPVQVFLDVYGPTKNPKDPNVQPDKVLTPKAPTRFNTGKPPHVTAEFDIKPALFAEGGTPGGKPEFAEGEWKFIARVPRDKRESFVQPFHVSEPTTVRVVKRPLRVLLFAGAATRDYQFVQTLLAREMAKQRVELVIHLQPPAGEKEPRKGIVQSVDPKRLLANFPTQFEDKQKKDDKGIDLDNLDNLSAYDVVIAFDPDWNRLSEEQMANLEQWVNGQGGGLIIVGGPVNTLQLARPGPSTARLKPIINLYPVVLEDARVKYTDRKTDRPWKLNFPGAKPDMEFLRLEEETENKPQLAGWEDFFGKSDANPDLPKRGFYGFYPVKKKKDSAVTIATYSDPSAKLDDPERSEQPYIVTGPYGGGRVVWIGSGEMWRLREYNEAFVERFWTKLTRYAAAGGTNRVNRRLVIVMGRTFTVNNEVQIEAQILGRNMKPLPENSRPTVVLKSLPPGVNDKGREDMPTRITMQAKTDLKEWNGWFSCSFPVRFPGDYMLEVEADQNDPTPAKFTVKDSNPETDETRPDYQALFELATDANPVLDRIKDPEQRKEVEKALREARPGGSGSLADKPDPDAPPPAAKGSDELRLYFDLKSAHLIPLCMKPGEETAETAHNRGAVRDLWDEGPHGDLSWINFALWIVNGVLIAATWVIGLISLIALLRRRSFGFSGFLLLTLVLMTGLAGLQIYLSHFFRGEIAAGYTELFNGWQAWWRGASDGQLSRLIGPPTYLFWQFAGVILAQGLLLAIFAGVLLTSQHRIQGAEVAFYLLFTLVLLGFLVPLQGILWVIGEAVLISIVLSVVILLLAIEWLSRKLLRLA